MTDTFCKLTGEAPTNMRDFVKLHAAEVQAAWTGAFLRRSAHPGSLPPFGSICLHRAQREVDHVYGGRDVSDAAGKALDQPVLAAHCTAQERNAAKVERHVLKSAAALLLSSRIGATFQGIVTGASDKGTWVRISGPTTEGRIVRGFQGLDVGDRVAVQLLHTDVDRGFIDFAAARAAS